MYSFSEDYIVFHSRDWAKEERRKYVTEGEADFTVFHPKRGILVIEVKSGGIRCDGRGNWFQTNTRTGEEHEMERRAVIVIDLDESAFIEEKSRRVLYVGASRAQHCLDFIAIVNEDQLGMIAEQLIGEKTGIPRRVLQKELKVVLC